MLKDVASRDAVIDGDADTLRDLLHQQPTLLDRKIARVDMFRHAANENHQAVTNVLAEYGAPWTIDAASALGRMEQVESLIAADPSILKSAEPLVAAARNDHVNVMALLLDRGAKIDQPLESGWTALYEAVRSTSVNAVEVLLSRGANTHAKEEWENTPLMMNLPRTSERKKIRDLFVAHGATPEDKST
jgi:ankyrin repeat protein